MKESEKERLMSVYPKLLEIRPNDILPILRQENVFDSDDEERILAGRTTKDRMEVLLRLLPLRGTQAYSVFRRALVADYDWIVKELDSFVTKSHDIEKTAGPIKEINHKTLRKVAHHPEVLRDWKCLARCLGVEEHDIVDIEYANQLNVKEASFQALIRWQCRKGKLATPPALISGIRESGFSHLADELEGKES